MKPILRPTVYFLLSVSIVFVSSKKETSCEGCAKPPMVIAGPDRVITLRTDSILLDGSSSSDPDGRISSYLWTKFQALLLYSIFLAKK